MNLDDCLPASLRGPGATITPIAAGLSGAGVYRVEAAGQVFVLKVSAEAHGEPPDAWGRRVHVQRLAADAGLAPRVVYVDEARRAVVSDFVADRSFPAFYGDPRTREAALALLGRTLRRLHELPLPPGEEVKDPQDLLAALWSGLADFALPVFVGEAVRRVLTEATARERAPVLSHNDVNPTNLVYDGANLLLLDWDAAGPNDPSYDPASISVFLRMDDAACRGLLAAYDGGPCPAQPARFGYSRRLAAALCGAAFLGLARRSGHTGNAGGETLASAPSLGDVYQRFRSGSLSPATGQGQWWFGLALVKTSAAL